MMRSFQEASLLTIICAGAVLSLVPTRRPLDDPLQPIASASRTEGYAQEVGENDVVRVTTSLVKVPVSVRDRDGRYIADLQKGDFHVYEGDTEQRIAHFGGVEEPISVVLLIDVSCSIDKPRDTIEAALTFIEGLRPADSVLPVAFASEVYALLTESTRDRALLRERILALPDGKQTPCGGATRLGDAIEFGIHRVLKKGTGPRAFILLTDGWDSGNSKPGWRLRTLRDASKLGVPFYSIRLVRRYRPNDYPFTGFPNDPPAERAKARFSAKDFVGYINDLASLSGGRSYPAATGESLKKYFNQIGEELRHQYMLGYYPGASKDTRQRRKIKVRVNRRNVSVRARDSYMYVPPSK